MHPITILSTLPSADVCAVLALMLLHTEFSMTAATRAAACWSGHGQPEADRGRYRARGVTGPPEAPPARGATEPKRPNRYCGTLALKATRVGRGHHRCRQQILELMLKRSA